MGEIGEKRIAVLVEKALKRKGERQDDREAMQEALGRLKGLDK